VTHDLGLSPGARVILQDGSSATVRRVVGAGDYVVKADDGRVFAVRSENLRLPPAPPPPPPVTTSEAPAP
jgi:hypothetical protein